MQYSPQRKTRVNVNGDLQYGNIGITSFDCSQIVVNVVEALDEIHEHANDLFEVRSH